jgi:filamentous hemagglutinin family protein
MSARPAPSWLFRSSALAIGVALVTFGATAPVHPQSFNATGTLASGDALITESAGATTVTLNTSQAVINWTPNDAGTGGGAIDFQSAGTTATFQGSSNFAVLNRIVPADPSRPVQFNGTVNSSIVSATGGTVYFYSPGGIILGAGARFDVGALGLSTADPVVDSTGAFIDANGKVIYNAAVPGTGVVINSGAQINAPVDQSSYVAIFAPYIRQDGRIDVNGSTALVAAEAGTITWNNGLFDVQVTTGTDGNAGVAIEHSGFTGGSTAGTGGTDRQRVYLVAVPKNTAITTLIAGGSQLGFDVAGAADVDGNKVILTAGYDVSGDSTSVSLGAGTGTADIVVTNSSVTSALTLTALNNATVQAVSGGSMSLASDLLVQALGTAQILSDGTGSSVQVIGTASLESDNVGFGPDLTGGTVRVRADNGGAIAFGASLSMSASGTGGDDPAGTGTGGLAELLVGGTGTGSSLTVAGVVQLVADGAGGGAFSGQGGLGKGGTALVSVGAGGTADFQSDVSVSAQGSGGYAYDGLGGDGTGGIAHFAANGGMVSISGVASVDTSGRGGYSSSAIGGTGTGGLAAVIADAGGVLSFDSLQTPGLTLKAVGIGASIEGSGSGGKGVSGTTQILAANGASITVQTDVSMESTAQGGSGANGGDADGSRDLIANPLGSTVLVNANGGTIAVGGALNIVSDSNGGRSFTQGGNGGAAHGGSVIVLAQAGASGSSSISLGSLTVSVDGAGGDAYSYGGSSSSPIAGGTGGAGAGGYVLLSGSAGNVSTGQDNGLLSIGNVSVTANGSGGSGGTGQDNSDIGAGADGGAGGSAVGGTVRIGAGSSILGPSATGGSVFGAVNVTVGASGGLGGNGGAGLLSGVNGNGGNGGSAVVSASRTDASQFFATGASVTADDVSFSLIAQGGGGGDGAIGGVGGDATAGEIDLILDAGASGQRGNLTLTSFMGTATATGGSGAVSGGSYYGSGPVVSLQHGDATIDSVQMTVSADGPSSFIAAPEARLYMRDSTLNASSSFEIWMPGNISVFADSATLTTATLSLQAADFVPDAGGVAPTKAGTLSADALGISTNNNIIMSAGLATPSQLFLNAPGEISVYGLNSPSNISLSAGGAITINGVASAPMISLTSSDIGIGTGGRLDAGSTGSVQLFGTNSAGMRIGDTSFGGGYILDRAEFSRISSGELSIYTLLTGLPVDMTVGDIDISAGQAGATIGNPDGAVTFLVGTQTQGYYFPAGTIRVTGSVRANGFSASNALVFADRTTEVDAERGLIEVTSDTTGTLGGTISFLGDRLHVAQAAILDRLEQDPYYAGRADDINTPLPVARPAGVVRAYTIDLSSAVGVLVQNTGNLLVPAGITFFADGPIWSPMMESPGIVEYIINGQLITSTGLLTGIAVHDFLIDDQNRNAFAEGSTINGCLVTTVDCPNPAASLLATGLGLPDFINILSTSALGGPDPVFDGSPSEEEEAAAGKSSPIPPPTPLIFTGPLNPPISVDEPVSGSGNPAFIGGAPANNNAGRGNQ